MKQQTFENLQHFFDKVKSVGFFERLFAWKNLVGLSYDAYEEFKSVDKTLESANEQLAIANTKVKELEKDFEETNKKIDTLIIGFGIAENKYEANLKKAKVDYEKLLADEKVAFTNHCERLEEKYREDLKDLEQKYKDVSLPEPEKPLLTFKEKVAKALEILFS